MQSCVLFGRFGVRLPLFLLLVAAMFVCAGLPAQGGEISDDVPSGFREIRLGLDIDTVKDRLQADPYFDYQGDPDVVLLQQRDQSLIECPGNSYVERSYLQFFEGSLYIITLLLDRSKIDYYTVFSSLSKKYGDPTDLNPREAVWVFDEVRLSVERPLSVKYIDRDVFQLLNREAAEGDQLRQISKEQFLDQL